MADRDAAGHAPLAWAGTAVVVGSQPLAGVAYSHHSGAGDIDTYTALPMGLPQRSARAGEWLPLVLAEKCPVDVALVLDASTSMRDDRTADGRTKSDAVADAVRTFLYAIELATGDQAALVTFNSSATLLQELTSDRARLEAALSRITFGRQSRIDLGITVASQELVGTRHVAGHAPSMIVVTDGRANPAPASEAVAAAQSAKASGIVVYTIGLGDDLDAEELAEMASGDQRYFHVPDAEGLAAVMRRIAYEIKHPSG